VLLTGTGIGIWALVKPDTGKEPPGPVAGGPTTTEDPTGTTTETTTGETGQTPAERVRAFFGPVNNSGCAEVAEADRLVAGAPVEIRCKPDSQGVDVSYVYFGTKKVMDDYTKFLQGRPDDIRISIDSPWEYTSPKGDVGYKISYYHPGVDESYIYWTYQDDLMGVIASRKGKDEATLEKWWLDVDILRHD
jgi:hypothetical protein